MKNSYNTIQKTTFLVALLSFSMIVQAQLLNYPKDDCNRLVEIKAEGEVIGEKFWSIGGSYDENEKLIAEKPIKFTIDPNNKDYIATGTCGSISGTGICRPEQFTLDYSVGTEGKVDVLYPTGEIPKPGWPVVIFFEGLGGIQSCQFYHTDFPKDGVIDSWRNDLHPNQAAAIKQLHDAGYAVIVPHATTLWRLTNLLPRIGIFWSTNHPNIKVRNAFEESDNYKFISTVIEHIKNSGDNSPNSSKFRKLDLNNVFTAGFSNGGSMASRLALMEPDLIKAIAVHNGEYANCFVLGELLPNPWCESALLPNEDYTTPVLLTHRFEDDTVPSTASKWYAYQLYNRNSSTENPFNITDWKAVIGYESKSFWNEQANTPKVGWRISKKPSRHEEHWLSAEAGYIKFIPNCTGPDDVGCVETFYNPPGARRHLMIDQAGDEMLAWFNKYKNREDTVWRTRQRIETSAGTYDPGSWGTRLMCPEESFVVGYRLKVAPYQGFFRDDTGVNAIELKCSDGSVLRPMANDGEAPWGTWGDFAECSRGEIATGFRTNDTTHQCTGFWGNCDDSALNDIQLRCSNQNTIAVSNGLDREERGTWSDWHVANKNDAICGASIKVMHVDETTRDDVGMSAIRFNYCQLSKENLKRTARAD